MDIFGFWGNLEVLQKRLCISNHLLLLSIKESQLARRNNGLNCLLTCLNEAKRKKNTKSRQQRPQSRRDLNPP